MIEGKEGIMTQRSNENSLSNTNKKGKTDRRVVRTKRALFDAYEKLLSDPDVSRITISSLPREAGVDRKTFYLHYSSLDDMINDMVDELVGRIMVPIMSLSSADEHKDYIDFLIDAEEFFGSRAALICQEFNAAIQENPAAVRHLFEYSTMGSLVSRFREPVLRDAEAFCDVPKERLEICSTYALGSIISCYHLWLTTDIDMTIDEYSVFVADLVSQGLSTYLHDRISSVKG